MDFADLLMTVAFLVTPPALLANVRHRLRAVIYSTLTLWLMMIAGSQYHIAYTPDYDSFASGLVAVIGWLPSAVYTLIWLGVFGLISLAQTTETNG